MTVRMHCLEAVAAECLPPHWTDSVRWLTRRLNRGELRGSRFGRVWMMSDDDVEFMVAKYRNVPTGTMPVVDRSDPVVATGSVSFIDGLSERSRARLLRGRTA
jgi:hypothetical protein